MSPLLQPLDYAPPSRQRIGRRWMIALLLTVAIGINYLDRQTLGIALKALRGDIFLSDAQFARLNSIFLLGYALMYMGGGRLLDLLGTRRGYIIIMIVWSLACASHSLAQTFGALLVCRLLLGLGEGGAFPGATRAVAEWFPQRERSTAMGMINAGTALGSMVAPPLLALIITRIHWRASFVAAGLIGLIWLVWWTFEYHPPSRHPRMSERDREIAAENDAHPTSLDDGTPIPWITLFSYPQVWGMVIGKFLTDAAWYFYSLWLAAYLFDMRGFDTKAVGYFAWIPPAASGIGSLLGGWFSSSLLHNGRSLDFSRKLAMGASVAFMPWMYFVTQVDTKWVIVLFSLAFLGQQSWSTLVMTLPADLFPRKIVGSVAGLVGCGGALGGIAFSQVIAAILAAKGRVDGYPIIFALASSFHVLAFVLILLTIPRIRSLRTESRGFPVVPVG